MKRLARFWQLASALTSGVLAAMYLPDSFYSEAVSEAVTVLGFLMAAFVPAMALAATSVRAGNLSVRQIRSLGCAVQVQIRVFGGLFFYSLAACIVLIVGKLLHWSIPMFRVRVVGWAAIDGACIFPGLLTFLFIFLVLRSGTFVAGTLSILNLSISSAEIEARLRDAEGETKAASDLETYQMPRTYGTVLGG